MCPWPNRLDLENVSGDTAERVGFSQAPLVQTLCIQRNAANRGPYRHLRSITSGTVVTEKTLINPDRPNCSMDGMDSISSSSPQTLLPHQPKNQRYCPSWRTLRSHTTGLVPGAPHRVCRAIFRNPPDGRPPARPLPFFRHGGVLQYRLIGGQKVSAATHDKAPSYRLNRHNRRTGTCCDFTVVPR
jgi:hypothetical protein